MTAPFDVVSSAIDAPLSESRSGEVKALDRPKASMEKRSSGGLITHTAVNQPLIFTAGRDLAVRDHQFVSEVSLFASASNLGRNRDLLQTSCHAIRFPSRTIGQIHNCCCSRRSEK